MAEVRIKDIDEHEIDTILAEDIDFEGHLTFKKPLMIKGKFKGEIRSTSALYIGEKAYVEATTEADIVSSKGRHKGDIHGHSRVELFSTAKVDGDITTPDFVVESGCKFNGNCNMGGESARKEEPVANPAASAGAASIASERPAHAPEQPPRAAVQQPRPQETNRNAEAHRAASPGAQQPQQQPQPPQQQPPQQQQQQQQQKPPFQPGGGGGQGGGQR
jgi:cytoskeletal protein CcmA (bactofilin family)